MLRSILAVLVAVFSLSASYAGIITPPKPDTSPGMGGGVDFLKFEMDGHWFIYFKTRSERPHETIMHAPSCPCRDKIEKPKMRA